MDNKAFWIIVLAVGAGLLISANIFRDTNPGPITDNSGTAAEPTDSPEPQTSPRPTAKSQTFLPPATCQISGEIVFLTKDTYENKRAKIVYQNVDDSIRQIYWKSDPDDGVLVAGPNLFEDLSIPNGERDIGVAFAKEPIAKNYTLTASVTYSLRDAGSIEKKVADCSGKINIDLSNI